MMRKETIPDVRELIPYPVERLQISEKEVGIFSPLEPSLSCVFYPANSIV